jgi:SAM-dependent methyltransferase
VDLNKLKPSGSQRLQFLGEFNFVERYKELLDKKWDKDHVTHPGGFDVVVHLEVIEHMKAVHGTNFLKACFACLKPGGVMLMSTPVYDGVRHAANHIHEYTVPELQKATEKAGFIVEQRFGTFMDIKHIKHIKKSKPEKYTDEFVKSIRSVAVELAEYFDNDAISNIFGPLYPDHARNNLWICRKPKK